MQAAVPERATELVQRSDFTGEIKARRSSSLSFVRGGRIDRLTVQEGDRVVPGQVLGVLDDRALRARQASLEAELTEANAVLGDLRAGPRNNEVEAARDAVRLAGEDLRLARVKNNRREQLFLEGAISREQLDDSRSQVRRLRVRQQQAQNQLAELRRGSRSGQIQAQRARLERIRSSQRALSVELEDTVLKAPFTAVIERRELDEGTYVLPGQAVYSLTEAGSLEAWIGVPESQLKFCATGSRHTLKTQTAEFKAVVTRRLPSVEARTRTETIIFELDGQASLKVKPGQLVSLSLENTTPVEGFWVPHSALTQGERGLFSCFALKKGDGGRYEVARHSVEVLHTEGERALIRGTLEPDLPIITSGLLRVVPGQEVNWP